MQILNYNSIVKKLNDFFSEEKRMLTLRESGCGKTNILMYILRKPLVYYDKG